MIIAAILTATGVLALVVSVSFMPIVITISRRREWYDIPNERKVHTGPIPRLGGVGIFFGLIAASLAVPLLLPVLFPGSQLTHYGLRYLPVFLAFCLVHTAGLVDDFQNIQALLKFLIQVFAAALVTIGGFTIATVSIPGYGTVSFGIFSYPITILWIVALSNAINLVDGVDGLAGGIAGFAALSLGLMCLQAGQITPAVISFALLGSVVGFLTFNLPPARIFMGDSGSLLLGFVLATIPLLVAPGETSLRDLYAPATVLLVPILDTFFAIGRRVKEKRAIHSPDKEHVHHKLLALGMKDTTILLVLYSSCVVLGAAAIGSFYLRSGPALILLTVVWGAGLIAYILLSSLRHRKKALQAGIEPT